MIATFDGKPQEKRPAGEPTGFVDRNNTPIRVGDHMTVNHWCDCEFCTKTYRCQVLWNDEWQAYGMQTADGAWHSGMGIAMGCQVER